MKLIKPSYKIMSEINSDVIMKNIEIAGRTCYKSEDKITSDSSDKFIRMLINRGHESVLEHEKITVQFICDRGVSHELVRHRIASFSQESTRYCNYSKEKNGSEITFIIPCWFNIPEGKYTKGMYNRWNCGDFHVRQHLYEDCIGTDCIPSEEKLKEIQKDNRLYNYLESLHFSENSYLEDIKFGGTPQESRSVLPNSLKTEIVVTANIREWRTIFKQRTSKAAHPQMRELMCPLLDEMKVALPALFEDIIY